MNVYFMGAIIAIALGFTLTMDSIQEHQTTREAIKAGLHEICPAMEPCHWIK